MGQYHGIYNKTKKEYYSFGGAKLWEKASSNVGMMGLLVLTCNSNGRGGGDLNNPVHKDDMRWDGKKWVSRKKAVYQNMYNREKSTASEYSSIQNALEVISGRWAGDEIVIQGDYAKEGDPAFIPENELDGYEDITELVVRAMELCCKHDEEVATTIKQERRYSRVRF